MGAVYLATDERFNSVVAIKETLCMDENFRKALEREARLLNSLKHSALPRVSDHFIEGEGQFLVMEFIPGDDLMQTLEQTRTPFSHEQVLNWADQILDALDYLHSQESPVIHRDIKPQNLKVTPKGQVILLDFGLAKGNVTDAGHLTAAKSIFGYSRNYASLEQIQGTGTDPRSDLYSLSATIYHLITGSAPEDALTRAMAVLSNQPDPLLPAASINSAIPAGVSAVLQNALDLTATRRPATASEFKQRLRDHEQFATAYYSQAAALPTNASVFGGPTIPNIEGTHAVGGHEAVTQLLPGSLSQLTSVRDVRSDPGTEAGIAPSVPQSPKRRLRYAFAGIFAIVAVCATSLGIFINRDKLFSRESTAVAPAATEVQQNETASEVNGANANVESISSASAGAASEQQDPTQEQSSATTERRSTVARSSANTATSSNSDAEMVPGDDDEKIVISGRSINVGNVKIKDGKVVTPEGEFPLKKQTPNFPNSPRMPPVQIDPRSLSPEQRKRLRMLRQKHPEVFVKPSPGPSPNF